jgi:hypothetical protein
VGDKVAGVAVVVEEEEKEAPAAEGAVKE